MHLRRFIVLPVVLAIFSAVPALAGSMTPDEARRFVAGKLFSYSCFEGTRGAGRINADGSVAGTIQVRGAAPRFVTLPANTIRMKPSAICAAVRGVAFEPCFEVVQTSQTTFRGSISGLGFAYCDFVKRNPRMELVGQPGSAPVRPHPIHADVKPAPVEPAVMTTATTAETAE
jgi:hypothetical protein